jgi:hypothetical protein
MQGNGAVSPRVSGAFLLNKNHMKGGMAVAQVTVVK